MARIEINTTESQTWGDVILSLNKSGHNTDHFHIGIERRTVFDVVIEDGDERLEWLYESDVIHVNTESTKVDGRYWITDIGVQHVGSLDMGLSVLDSLQQAGLLSPHDRIVSVMGDEWHERA